MGLRSLSVALVGAGRMGAHHARVLAAEARLVAVVDRVPERAAALAARYGAQALGALPSEVDAVVVATPAASHAEWAQAALRAGAWVLVEKPLATDLEDAWACADPHLRVGHSERFNPQLRSLKPNFSLLRADRLLLPRAEEPPESAAVDLLIHDLDLFLWWTGARDGVLTAEGSRHEGRATLRVMSGQEGHFSFSRRASQAKRALKWVGEGAVVTVDLAAPPAAGIDALTAQWRAFVAAMQGEISPMATGPEGAAALALALRAQDLCWRD